MTYGTLFESTLKSAGSSVGLAVKNFEKQVASDPDTADKFFWLGAACMIGASAQKDPTYLDRAIGFFEEALKINPKHKNTYAKLLGAYMSKKDHHAVRRTAMRWAKVDPDLPQEARQWLSEQEAITAVLGTAEERVQGKKPDEIYCPSCSKPINKEAVVCHHCGVQVKELKVSSRIEKSSIIIKGAKKLQATSRLFLVSGIINIIAGIIATAFGWFLGILSILLGIWELVNAGRYWTLPPKTTRNPVYIGVLEIINIVCGPLWSLFFGIGTLTKLKSPETKAYFAMLEKGGGIPLSQTKKCPKYAEKIKIEKAKPLITSNASDDAALEAYEKTYLCKAYKSGRCIVMEKDTGPCTWKPEDWATCNVVIENKKFYGSW